MRGGGQRTLFHIRNYLPICLSCFLLYLESTPRELFKTSKFFKIRLLEIFSEHFEKNNSSIFGEIVNPQVISLRFPMCSNMLLHIGNLKEITWGLTISPKIELLFFSKCSEKISRRRILKNFDVLKSSRGVLSKYNKKQDKHIGR